ncbi:MAG: 2-hydroxyacyl-CoA dehydratase subunit D [Candidatus Methanofastidiosia archaeon]
MTLTKKPYRKLQSSKYLKKIMTKYYRNSKILPYLGRNIAWISSGAPVEILRAMKIYPLYPENFGALCGAQRISTRLCEVAESHGYSQDLCSYARNSIGSVLNGSIAPMRGLRKPDLLVCSNNICATVVKWFEALRDHFKVPLFVLDTPFVEDGLEPHTIDYVKTQLLELVSFLERHTQNKLKEKNLMDVLERSIKAVSLWTKILKNCKAIPTPLNCPDRFIGMAPIVCLRGEKDAISYYERLLYEEEKRMREKKGAIKDEKFRLLWDNIPLWFNIYNLFNSLAGRGVSFPADTYTHAWSGKLNLGDPFLSLTEVYTSIFLNRGLNYKIDLMKKLIKDYSLDGFVMHSDRSCKSYSLGQLDIKRVLSEETGVPGIIIEGDMCDSRNYDEVQAMKKMEIFLEVLG